MNVISNRMSVCRKLSWLFWSLKYNLFSWLYFTFMSKKKFKLQKWLMILIIIFYSISKAIKKPYFKAQMTLLHSKCDFASEKT